jgi:hypothetical protein
LRSGTLLKAKAAIAHETVTAVVKLIVLSALATVGDMIINPPGQLGDFLRLRHRKRRFTQAWSSARQRWWRLRRLWWRWLQRLRRLRRWLRSWLRRRLQSRLRLWRLRRLWLRRLRPGLVGCLRYRVCRRYRCSLLHILGRLPLLLRPAPHSALSRQRRLHAAVIPHPLNRHYERIDSGPACGARALPHGECDYGD